MSTSTLTRKGRTTIPKDVRNRLALPLAGCGKTTLDARNSVVRTWGTTGEHSCRMLKKAVQQGRSE